MRRIVVLVLLVLLVVPFQLLLRTSGFQVEQASNRFYVVPSSNIFYTSQKSVGDLFNVTVWVDTSDLISAWQVYMEFNDSMINVTRWFEPTWDPQYIFYGNTTSAVPSPPTPSYSRVALNNESILVAANLFPTPPSQLPRNGTGKLCILEFNVTAVPPTGGSLTSPLALDKPDTFVLDEWGGTILNFTKEDGSYALIYNVPPPSYLRVDPNFVWFSPYEDVQGKSFNVSVLAADVSSSVNLNNISFTLAYDQSIVGTQQLSVTFDGLWGGPNTATIAEGRVNVTVANPTSTPSGVVSLCKIEFTVLLQQESPPLVFGSNVSTGLNIIYGKFFGAGGEVTSAAPQNGLVRIYGYHPETALLAFDPPVYNRTVVSGQQFTVNVTSSQVFDLHSVRVRILYDKNVLSCSHVQIGTIFTDVNVTQVLGPYDSDINDTFGFADLNATVQPAVAAPLPIVSGWVFLANFTVIANGTTSLNFSKPYGIETLLVDSLGNVIPVTYQETPLQAYFIYSSTKPTIQDAVSFTDQSVDLNGNITSWHWDFGDGVSSMIQYPQHTFSQKGNHTVTLTVTDNNTAQSSTSQIVTVYNLPPIANFTYDPANPHSNQDIQFFDTSTDPEHLPLSSWLWSFGDGGSSTLQNAPHRYAAKGNYTVTLTVADDEGATNSISKIVTVINLPPVANFTFTPVDPNLDEDVQFTDASSSPQGFPLTWFWNFGDGANSTLQNPIHKFATSGNFTVTLTVKDDQNVTGTISAFIVVASPPPQIPIWLVILILVIIVAIVVVIVYYLRRRKRK